MPPPPLDLLLYSHDGRGLGHASRTIAIGMALRRLYPELKVLFVSGTPQAGELIADTPLDWIKLPAYETGIIDGISKGVPGKSNFSDTDLGVLRGTMLRQIVDNFRPKVILADHSPLGKHKELLPALENLSHNPRVVLGVRGVVGDVRQVVSQRAIAAFSHYYSDLLWYGDSKVLGSSHSKALHDTFSMVPFETGYVSRMNELQQYRLPKPHGKRYAGTIAIPWLGEHSIEYLKKLALALTRLNVHPATWNIFLPKGGNCCGSSKSYILFPDNCVIRSFGPEYHHCLRASYIAVIYGGYNSITDVLVSGTPALVVLRNMQDQEQQLHLEHLTRYTNGRIAAVEERSATPESLCDLLKLQLSHAANTGSDQQYRVNLDGAAHAARYLAALL